MINIFRSNYWLLFEAMAVHPMGVGVSLSSPVELGLDSQVSGLTTCALLPIGIRKCSSEAIQMTYSHDIIWIIFPVIAMIVHFWAAGRWTLPQPTRALPITALWFWGTRLTSGPCRLHKSCCNSVNSYPINRIIAFIAIIGTVIVIILKCGTAIQVWAGIAFSPGPESNHLSSSTTNSPCPTPGSCWTASAEYFFLL